MGAADDRHILDDKQVLAFAVTTRHVTNASTLLTTNITYHTCCCSVGFTEAPIMRCHISAGLQPPSPMWAIIFLIIPGII